MKPPRDADAAPLDERLVQVALALLDDEGLERLSLRRIARRAGVSHGAPLRHFRSLADLRSEVAARGFALLTETLVKSSAQLPPEADALVRLAAVGRAYVDVAIAHPGLFALMFRPDDLDADNPHLRRASSGAFEQLLTHVRAAQDAGWRPQHDTGPLAGAIWASVHGLATLWSQGALQGPLPDASLDDVITITLELAGAGRHGGTS